MHYLPTGSAQIKFYMSLQNEELVLIIRHFDSVIIFDDFVRIIGPFYQSVCARQLNTGGYDLGLYLCH